MWFLASQHFSVSSVALGIQDVPPALFIAVADGLQGPTGYYRCWDMPSSCWNCWPLPKTSQASCGVWHRGQPLRCLMFERCCISKLLWAKLHTLNTAAWLFCAPSACCSLDRAGKSIGTPKKDWSPGHQAAKAANDSPGNRASLPTRCHELLQCKADLRISEALPGPGSISPLNISQWCNNTTCKMWFINLNDKLDTSQTVASLSALIWSQVSLTCFGFNIICKARRSFCLRNLASLFFWRIAPETETWPHIGLVQTAHKAHKLNLSDYRTASIPSSTIDVILRDMVMHTRAKSGKKDASTLIWSMFSTVAASRAVARGWR